MGSVQMCIECEQCSYEFAMDDYNYRRRVIHMKRMKVETL